MNFLKLTYWFNGHPGPLVPSVRAIYVIIIIALAVLAVIFFILKNKDRKKAIARVWRKLSSFFSTNAAFALILLFFTDQAVPVLSSRVLFLILVAEMAVWFYFIIEDALKIPKMLEQQRKEAEYKKYIP
ncbi:MAG: hypothetical protein ABH881_01295 [bacterium]